MKKYIHPYAPIVMAVIGLFFLGMGIFRMNRLNKFPATEAIITNIEAYFDVDDTLDHDVTVRYTVDGKTYESELDHYKDDFEVGKTVEIHYDPNDPTVILYASNFPSYGSMGFGGLLLVLSIYAVIQLRR